MPVTKHYRQVWSSPKQKEQIFFKCDPALQRPLRVGCCKTIAKNVIPPVITNVYSSYLNINDSVPSIDPFTSTFLVNTGDLTAIYLTKVDINNKNIILSIGNTGTIKIQKSGAPDIIRTYTVFTNLATTYSLDVPSETMPSGYSTGDVITITLL